MRGGYHGLDALREEEAVVQCVHGVVGLHGALPLQQDGPGVQSVVGPEHAEAGFLIAPDQGPVEGRRKKKQRRKPLRMEPWVTKQTINIYYIYVLYIILYYTYYT